MYGFFFLGINTIIAYLFYAGILWFNNPSKIVYPIRGIDISHHQGAINWKALKSEKIDFIYMKATEGSDFIDKQFLANWERANKDGYKVGAYHFYRLCTDWRAQANNIINTIPSQHDTLPVAIDLEYLGNCKTSKSYEEVHADLRAMVHVLEDHYGRKPIFYVTDEFYENYIMGEFEDISLWYRDIFTTPHIKDGRDWLFWQYSNRGHMKGIEGYVDLNVFHGGEKAFHAFVKSK